jgi:chromosome segregation ATPase
LSTTGPAERKLETASRINTDQANEIIRLQAELKHRPIPVSWNVIDEHVHDLGEQRAIEGEIVPDTSAEEIATLKRQLAERDGQLAAAEAEKTRLAGDLTAEKELTSRLERDNRALEEKVEEDRRDWAAQEAKRQQDAEQAGQDSARELSEAQADVARLTGELAELNGKLTEANEFRSQAEAKAARAAEDLSAEKRRADQAEEDLAAERDKPAPPPAAVDVAAVRATADEEAKDRVATIIMSIEEDNPGISLNDSLDLFATAWAAPRVEEPEPGQDGDAPADLFDFTLPPPAENEEIPYVPSATAAAAEN